MKEKTPLLIFFLLFLLIVTIVVQILNKQEAQKTEEVKIIDRETPQPTLNIKGVNLNSGLINLSGEFSVIFSEPVNLDDISVSVNPETEVYLTLDKSMTLLTITPKKTWQFETEYQVIFKKGSMGLNGGSLGTDRVLKFKTVSYGGI